MEKEVKDYFIGVASGLAVCVVTGIIIFTKTINSYEDPIRNSCRGTPWVIDEPLIKKTLTCVVELKGKK